MKKTYNIICIEYPKGHHDTRSLESLAIWR